MLYLWFAAFDLSVGLSYTTTSSNFMLPEAIPPFAFLKNTLVGMFSLTIDLTLSIIIDHLSFISTTERMQSDIPFAPVRNNPGIFLWILPSKALNILFYG